MMTRSSDERGVALVTAMLLTLIILVLGTGLLALEPRRATDRDRLQESAADVRGRGRRARSRTRGRATGDLQYRDDDVLVDSQHRGGRGHEPRRLDRPRQLHRRRRRPDDRRRADRRRHQAQRRHLPGLHDERSVGRIDRTRSTGTGDGRRPRLHADAFAARRERGRVSAVQGIFRGLLPFPIPSLPGAVTLPGPVDRLRPGNDVAMLNGNGGDPPCFATSRLRPRRQRRRHQRHPTTAAINRWPNYMTCNPNGAGNLVANTGSVENFINTTNGTTRTLRRETNMPILTRRARRARRRGHGLRRQRTGPDLRVGCLNNIVSKIHGQRRSVGGYSRRGADHAQLGSRRIPNRDRDGNLTIETAGKLRGILVVTGNFEMSGTTRYTGTILVVGNGRRERRRQRVVCGGILVADTSTTTTTAGTIRRRNVRPREICGMGRPAALRPRRRRQWHHGHLLQMRSTSSSSTGCSPSRGSRSNSCGEGQ